MDYYSLVPTYLNRLIAVDKLLRPGTVLLNVGCGKGGFNHLLRKRFKRVIGMDINAFDIAVAKSLTKDSHIQHYYMDAEKMEFPDASFDAIICIDVLEHVKNKERVLREINRVLKPKGQLIVSVPNKNYPWTFDPLNKLADLIGIGHIPIGAYGCGHQELPTAEEIGNIVLKTRMQIRNTYFISHHLVGLLELYHITLLQRFFKENASNDQNSSKRSILRYDYNVPRHLQTIPKTIIALDELLFSRSKKSINIVFDIVKQ